MREGKVNVVNLVLTLVAIYGALCVYRFGPYYYDHIVMNEIVKTCVLTWKDRDEPSAHNRLGQELLAREVPDYIDATDCKFTEQKTGKNVTCEWTVGEQWPLVSEEWVKHFVSEANLNPDGTVE